MRSAVNFDMCSATCFSLIVAVIKVREGCCDPGNNERPECSNGQVDGCQHAGVRARDLRQIKQPPPAKPVLGCASVPLSQQLER